MSMKRVENTKKNAQAKLQNWKQSLNLETSILKTERRGRRHGSKWFVPRPYSHFECSLDKYVGILIVLNLSKVPRGKV